MLGSVGIPNLSRSTLLLNKSDEGYNEMRIVKSNFRANRGIMRFNIASMEPTEAKRRVAAAKVKLAGDPKRILQNFSSVEVKCWVSEDGSSSGEESPY